MTMGCFLHPHYTGTFGVVAWDILYLTQAGAHYVEYRQKYRPGGRGRGGYFDIYPPPALFPVINPIRT